MSSFAKWSRRSKSGKDDHMNRKLNAAITAGLSLSMVLGSTPVTAIAAQVQQPAAKGASEVVWRTFKVRDVASKPSDEDLYSASVMDGTLVADALGGSTYNKPGYKIKNATLDDELVYNYDEATNTWSGPQATVTSDMTVYISYEKQETPAVKTHTVTYYDEGHESIGHFEDYDGTTTWLQRTPAPKDGKVFVGWKFVDADDSEIIPAGTELKGDWSVQAVWKDAEAAFHTVQFYDEGYDAFSSAKVQAGTYNWDLNIRPEAKEGYTFVGYKFTGDTDDHIIDFSKTAMPDADVCLQAVWQKNAEPAPEPTENEHTVTIYVKGTASTVKVKDGEKLAKPADPEAVAGYKFVGWSTSKSEMAQYDFDQPVTGDFTIYAMFSAKKETVENGKAEDSKKQVAADKKDEVKAKKKDAAALPTTGDPTFVVTSAAALTGAVAVAVGMYMTKRREH